ncbi:MAG TPA: spore germination protein [Methylomusa anaerophila]|uniref:Spore germination protein A1 n=1 Tax=Methylomusa anaerophila TaxID=1930071 RepID=A0A348AGY9_9FIRM|nr:spore germination protein [Methylomusa anaerophila]BBB90337.1 spore germination protein A1 [Methylomusa anaerophila]HML89317.1 spore germination protein [Methylomusa anaerophila]
MNNIFTKNYHALKKLIIYKPPANPPQFTLAEDEESRAAESKAQLPQDNLHLIAAEHDSLLRYARRLADALAKIKECLAQPLAPEKIAALKMEIAALENQQMSLSPIVMRYNLAQNPLDQAVSTSLEENRLALKRLYNVPANKDLIIRSITIPAEPPVTATLVFVEGLSDKKIINLAVLQPLLLLGNVERRLYDGQLATRLITEYLPGNQVRVATTLRDVVESLNLGDTAIFLDGVDEAVLVETKGQEHRNIDRPLMEQTVQGGQSAFTETLRVNTGLVRSLLRTNDLTTEIFTIGHRSNTLCAVMYLKSVANPVLVREVKRRLSGLKVDAITDSGTLLHHIIDHPGNPYPQALRTERPDRVAAALAEGRLAIMLDGSPFVLITPVSLFTLFHTGEDFSVYWVAASFSRVLRFLGAFLTLLMPALYIAISYFHEEALPTSLIIAIAGARERVPFPSILEIAMMEFSFELLREAGVRIPGMLGSTIGIVGAIILGQAAVAAGIVSPITVVIIAVTGLASFGIPDYSLSHAIRLTRFAFEVLAATFGLVGVASGLLALTVVLTSMKSLGVPYMSPVAPKSTAGYDIVLRGPLNSQELRPDELNPLDRQRQASVGVQWPAEQPAGGEDES